MSEAGDVDITGWDFGWLDGRAAEERPPWGYARLVASRLPEVASALDLDTGGGEVMAEMPSFPHRMCVTESWPPNVQRARDLLGPRGVEVVETDEDQPLPFPDATFDLVTSRHPVRPDWKEIARVLAPGGTYLAQHVGPASALELIEYFLGPLPKHRSARDPHKAAAAATAAGLTVVDLQTARCRLEFFDIGAAVYILRKCVWWVPDFTIERYLDNLRDLDAQIRADGMFVAHSSRYLIEARHERFPPVGRTRTEDGGGFVLDPIPAEPGAVELRAARPSPWTAGLASRFASVVVPERRTAGTADCAAGERWLEHDWHTGDRVTVLPAQVSSASRRGASGAANPPRIASGWLGAVEAERTDATIGISTRSNWWTESVGGGS